MEQMQEWPLVSFLHPDSGIGPDGRELKIPKSKNAERLKCQKNRKVRIPKNPKSKKPRKVRDSERSDLKKSGCVGNEEGSDLKNRDALVMKRDQIRMKIES